jgi:hypothetical protein
MGLIEYLFDDGEEFHSPDVSVIGAFSSGTGNMNFVPFQVCHIGPYFGIIRTTKLYNQSFAVPLFPIQQERNQVYVLFITLC